MTKPSPRTDSTHRTQTTLVRRLKDWQDQESWQRFFESYWKLIYTVALKAGLTEPEAQDVVQETVLTVAKNITGFEYDRAKGSFRGWLLNITRWRIADQFRKRTPSAQSKRSSIEEGHRTASLERIPDPAGVDLEAVWEIEWQKNQIAAAMQRLKKKVDAKQFQVFDLHVNRGLSVREVARAAGVSSGYVYLTKHRLTALLKKEVKALETKPI